MIAIYIIIGLVAGVAVGWFAGRSNEAKAEGRVMAMREELERSDRLWQSRFDKMKEELGSMNARNLALEQSSLQSANREQIGNLLTPLREQFEIFRRTIEESRTSNEVSKKEIKDSFEHTMRLFEKIQQTAVTALKEETSRIGNEASNLTRALKQNTKKQGDWGEMILESLLESSGLEKGRQYFIQENVKDEGGRNLRPDVIVRFPEGRSIVIDSKVSLTAYMQAFEAEDTETKLQKMKEHAKSVKRHVDELVEKRYDTLVEGSIGFVLMFIPNDQCYLAALEQERELENYAFSKGVVILSPANIMIALRLAYNLWQQDARNRNIDKIVASANDLYDKVAGFSETIEALERSIGRLNNDFTKAKNQLYEGNGNIMGRVEHLKQLGLTPNKGIKGTGRSRTLPLSSS